MHFFDFLERWGKKKKTVKKCIILHHFGQDMCQTLATGEVRRWNKVGGFGQSLSLLLESSCNASALLISFPQCTEDWQKRKLTASMIQGDFLLQSGPAMCGAFLMSAGLGSGCWGGGAFLWGEEVRVEYWSQHPKPPH